MEPVNMNMPAINSSAYWDYRFAHDWDKCQGREQTRFFARIAMENLPDWFAAEVKKNRLTICDLGCAEGDGADLISRALGGYPVTGIDFSVQAIAKAKKNYPALNFLQRDILAENAGEYSYDIVFSSNTLEHFPDPADVLGKILDCCRWGAILLLPFREYLRLQEHSATFDFSTLPLVQRGEFILVHSRIVDTRSMSPTYWAGEQILLLFLRIGQVARLHLCLENIHLETSHFHAQMRLGEEKIRQLHEKCAWLEEHLRSMQARHANLEMTFAAEKENLQSLQKNIEAEKIRLQMTEEHLDFALNRLRLLEAGWSWKLTRPLRAVKSAAASLRERAGKVLFLSRREGLWRLALRCRMKYLPSERKPDPRCRAMIDTLVLHDPERPTVVFRPVIDWNVPLFQRPQHIAANLAALGWNYIYCTPGVYDHDIKGIRKKAENLYLTDQYPYIEEILLGRSGKPVIFHCYAQDHQLTADLIDRLLAAGHWILYEYIDAIDDKLSVAREKIMARHLRVLRDERCFVVATAGNLLDEVRQFRNRNFLQVTNGVDFDHFNSGSSAEAPAEISALANGGKPVVGYFGALASWFDFELIIRLAKARPQYEILLLGWDYDGTVAKYRELSDLPNLTILGPVSYADLPRFARHFTVATIPFLLNDITRATNPIKLFEYMALGHPIVTTDLPECRKYRSPLIARMPEDFLRLIDEAIGLRQDDEYRQILRAEALANTWEAKAREMAGLVAPGRVEHAANF